MNTKPKIQAVAPVEPIGFSGIYHQYFDYVYRIVSRLSAGRDVDDLTQDVFVIVHRKLASFDNEGSIEAWLFQICYRVVRGHQRKFRWRRLLWQRFMKEPACPATPLQTVEDRQATDQLRAAVERLAWKSGSGLTNGLSKSCSAATRIG